MDPLDTMTAADWRRVYERGQERIKGLLDQGAAARRREAELIDRLRRRDTRVRELEDERDEAREAARTYFHNGASAIQERAMAQHRLEAENQKLRDSIAARIVEEELSVQQQIAKEPLNSWLAGALFGLQRARDIANKKES